MGRESLVDQLIAELLADIVAGRLQPEQPLPAEAELATRFEVNRLTIREALRKLQAQGIVSTVPGRRSALNPVARWTDIMPPSSWSRRESARRNPRSSCCNCVG